MKESKTLYFWDDDINWLRAAAHFRRVTLTSVFDEMFDLYRSLDQPWPSLPYRVGRKRRITAEWRPSDLRFIDGIAVQREATVPTVIAEIVATYKGHEIAREIFGMTAQNEPALKPAGEDFHALNVTLKPGRPIGA